MTTSSENISGQREHVGNPPFLDNVFQPSKGKPHEFCDIRITSDFVKLKVHSITVNIHLSVNKSIYPTYINWTQSYNYAIEFDIQYRNYSKTTQGK